MVRTFTYKSKKGKQSNSCSGHLTEEGRPFGSDWFESFIYGKEGLFLSKIKGRGGGGQRISTIPVSLACRRRAPI